MPLGQLPTSRWIAMAEMVENFLDVTEVRSAYQSSGHNVRILYCYYASVFEVTNYLFDATGIAWKFFRLTYSIPNRTFVSLSDKRDLPPPHHDHQQSKQNYGKGASSRPQT